MGQVHSIPLPNKFEKVSKMCYNKKDKQADFPLHDEKGNGISASVISSKKILFWRKNVMSTSEFTKRWSRTGFTYGEAVRKKATVDQAHGVGTASSKWNPAEIVDDDRGGFKVIITTKD